MTPNYSAGLPTGLTLNAATGVISGTATGLGTSPFELTVTDSENPPTSAQTTTSITVAATTLSISCPLPVAVTGAVYAGVCTAAGGISPYSYSITSGSLPVGLTLDLTNGTISGTPLNAGPAPFVITVTDSLGDEQRASFNDNSFVVAPGPLVLSCTFPPGTTGSSYSGECSTVGGSPPVLFSINSLPAGLTLEGGGHVEGYLTVAGIDSFTVTATDSASPPQIAQLNETVAVAEGPLAVGCYFPAVANVHNPLKNVACGATGGTVPFAYSISSGALPAGLTLNGSTGIVSGAPATTGTSSFTVKVTDGSVPPKTATFTDSSFVVQPTPPLTLTCQAQNLMGNLQSQFYGTCNAIGGNPPDTASVISGTLPPGLSISTYPFIALGAETPSGTIVQFTGYPSQIGTTSVTVQVTDGSIPALIATAQVTFTVGPRLQESGLVTITATSGGITNTTTIAVGVP